jgi:hypothetical protein
MEEMIISMAEILAKFPGWDSFVWESATEEGNGERLYSQSVDLATDAVAVAFNYVALRLGLSSYQASIVTSKLHEKLFGARR